MKKIVVLGAGLVTKPAVDYFLDHCGFHVTVTSLKKEEAQRLVGDRPNTRAMAMSLDNSQNAAKTDSDKLDQLVSEADLVMSMLPPSCHLSVARTCLKHRKNMVTTSYISPEMEALNEEALDRSILILNEIGEDPGLDNMSTKRLIDRIQSGGGTVKSVWSYGAGLPAFESNNNPFGYKFSWSPIGVILAALSPAAYMDNGTFINVPSGELFDHHRLVDLEGIGTFETYPNRDSTKYLNSFQLTDDVTLYRGILRYPGWCNTMKYLYELGLFNMTVKHNQGQTTYARFMADLTGKATADNVLEETAEFLGVRHNSDIINKLEWLGLFSHETLNLINKTNADILVDAMLKKMSYHPSEKDMVIVHTRILAEYRDYNEECTSTLLIKGLPYGDSAMSRAVSLPAAIASRLILEGDISMTGVLRPTFHQIYHPVLEEMKTLGYSFDDRIIKQDK